jgi:hypothetical protein
MNVFPKISSPCVALRAVTPVMTRWFEISLLCTYSLHHVLWGSFWGNLIESRIIFAIPMKIICVWQVSRKEVLIGNYLRNFICFHLPVNTYFHNCLSWSSMETFQTNSAIRCINMRHKHNHLCPMLISLVIRKVCTVERHSIHCCSIEFSDIKP